MATQAKTPRLDPAMMMECRTCRAEAAQPCTQVESVDRGEPGEYRTRVHQARMEDYAEHAIWVNRVLLPEQQS